jgi:hypothetical protein
MSLQTTKDEVIFKVGCNVLLFQKMEHILKYIVMNGNFSAHASQLLSVFELHKNSVRKQTLGKVVGKYLDNTQPEPPPDDIREGHIRFSLSVGNNDEKREVIESLVAERNHLVHHLLLDYDEDSIDSRQEAGRSLDSQSKRLKAEIAELRQHVRSLHEGRLKLAEYIQTDEFREQLK